MQIKLAILSSHSIDVTQLGFDLRVSRSGGGRIKYQAMEADSFNRSQGWLSTDCTQQFAMDSLATGMTGNQRKGDGRGEGIGGGQETDQEQGIEGVLSVSGMWDIKVLQRHGWEHTGIPKPENICLNKCRKVLQGLNKT